MIKNYAQKKFKHEQKRRAERKLMRKLGGYRSPAWQAHKEAIARRITKTLE